MIPGQTFRVVHCRILPVKFHPHFSLNASELALLRGRKSGIQVDEAVKKPLPISPEFCSFSVERNERASRFG
jgi:hypothetical protein